MAATTPVFVPMVHYQTPPGTAVAASASASTGPIATTPNAASIRTIVCVTLQNTPFPSNCAGARRLSNALQVWLRRTRTGTVVPTSVCAPMATNRFPTAVVSAKGSVSTDPIATIPIAVLTQITAYVTRRIIRSRSKCVDAASSLTANLDSPQPTRTGMGARTPACVRMEPNPPQPANASVSVSASTVPIATTPIAASTQTTAYVTRPITRFRSRCAGAPSRLTACRDWCRMIQTATAVPTNACARTETNRILPEVANAKGNVSTAATAITRTAASTPTTAYVTCRHTRSRSKCVDVRLS